MLLLLFTYLNRPTKYQVDIDKIIIHRPIGNIEMMLQDFARIDRIQHDLLKNANKGGAFGYFGNHDTDLGQIQFYATRRDKLVKL